MSNEGHMADKIPMKFAPRGRVYLWIQDPEALKGGRVSMSIEPLLRLDGEGIGTGRLWGRYVRVRNGGEVNEPTTENGGVRSVPIGNARPDAAGNFLFVPRRGGGRIDKVRLASKDLRWRYIQASHFGEVNTYFHLDRIADYINGLLRRLGHSSLPRVTAVVNAHHAATERDGVRDGVPGTESGQWLPFQGGHYRLPCRRYDVNEFQPIAPTGEIHLGPGWQLLRSGAVVEAAGRPYWSNASHNAAILYHEYGHHIMRHTADIMANSLRPPDRQSNRKRAIDEGTADYWAAAMLGTPHIWAWHRRHDNHEVHPRSLSSPKTMADYDRSPRADPHVNGTIWAAALWDLRTRMEAAQSFGAYRADLLVLEALLELGKVSRPEGLVPINSLPRLRARFAVGLAALLQADELINGGRYREEILACFNRRAIHQAQDASMLVRNNLCQN